MSKLLEIEVPEEYRSLFDFSSQVIEVRKGRSMLCIDRGCVKCPARYTVPVSQIRGDFKRGRRMAGNCMSCRKDKITVKDGYVWLYRPEHPRAYSGKYVPEHTYVMEKSLGRYLTEDESVHHIDGSRANNDLSNLQLRKRYHGKGQKWTCSDCGSHNITATQL